MHVVSSHPSFPCRLVIGAKFKFLKIATLSPQPELAQFVPSFRTWDEAQLSFTGRERNVCKYYGLMIT